MPEYVSAQCCLLMATAAIAVRDSVVLLAGSELARAKAVIVLVTAITNGSNKPAAFLAVELLQFSVVDGPFPVNATWPTERSAQEVPIPPLLPPIRASGSSLAAIKLTVHHHRPIDSFLRSACWPPCQCWWWLESIFPPPNSYATWPFSQFDLCPRGRAFLGLPMQS